MNCGNSRGRSQYILWRAEDFSVPASVKYITVICGTNNLNDSESKRVINAIIRTGKIFQEKSANFTNILTSVL